MKDRRVAAAALSAASQTDPGRVRSNNEDLPLCDSQSGVYAVIDGVGGEAAGEVAAEIARRVILERLARPLGTPAERVREAIALANNEIFETADESPAHHGMTCVLTLAVVTSDWLTVGHVGDSRLYKFRPDGFRKLTHDHSPIGEREDAQEISEVEAMHHPRRNEVFRDVGSENRDKDDEGFVEIVEDTLENDCAILLCTDGLSDMVPSSIIEHLVRQHAGHPQAVVDALVSAANEAGGRDNVTVVYAEAPEFARGVRDRGGPLASVQVATQPGPNVNSPVVNGVAPAAVGAPEGPQATRRARPRAIVFARLVPTSRITWFACGAVVGVVAALILVFRLGGATRARTLVVGGTGSEAFASIAAAMARARPGDVVQLEPGTYKEQVVVPDGVDLVARLAGKAVLARAAVESPTWSAITATGNSGGRIYGIRIVSTSDNPVQVGMRISGQGRRIELVDVSGPMRAGIELTEASAVTIRGSLLHMARGPAVTLDDTSDATIANNTFVRVGGPVEPALSIRDANQIAMTRNVFVGYGLEIVRGVSADERLQLLSDNFVVPIEPIVAR